MTLAAFSWVMVSLSGCGGGGSGGSGPTTPAEQPVAPVPSFVQLSSAAGEFIGQGKTYRYDLSSARITVTASGSLLTISIAGDERWSGRFQLPGGLTQLQVGTYPNLPALAAAPAAAAGMAWFGDSRQCGESIGQLTITKASYQLGSLTELEAQFEQRCAAQAPALSGQIRWFASDTTAPPGPAAVPATLWSASASNVPATGNYIYLESQAGDPVGQGGSFNYTQATALISTTAGTGAVAFSVRGDKTWTGSFYGMDSLTQLRTGYYPNLTRYPIFNPVRGGFAWAGSTSCAETQSWFAVDSVSYSGNTLTAIELRFEQKCGSSVGVLRGQIRWRADDPTTAPGPVDPPPTTLWRAPPAAVPAAGSYVYLQSQTGDTAGQGRTLLYTPANAVLTVGTANGATQVNVQGDMRWSGQFAPMSSPAQPRPGYYGSLQRFPFHNPQRGGLSWTGDGSICSNLTGWFVVDAVSYLPTGALSSLSLRFEQFCDGSVAALRGQLRWSAGDAVPSPGPQVPVPTGLWAPAAGATPIAGTYVYLESAAGDRVGGGRTYLYTKATAELSVSLLDRVASVAVTGDQRWNGRFSAMSSLTELQVGYYGEVTRIGFQNPLRGGMDWNAGCNSIGGWFAVDSLTRVNGVVQTFELRFEQYCDGSLAPLRGKVRWDASDTTAPPGPVVPPASLWRAPASSVPPTGNFLYLQSEPGDPVGQGQTYLYGINGQNFALSGSGNQVSVVVGIEWRGQFLAMNHLQQLEPGYYSNLGRAPFHNPVRGGLTWAGLSGSCNAIAGWMVVDSVQYSNGSLSALELRFEQLCDGVSSPLRGQIRWRAN
jgi:hypothetical protein